MLVWLHHERGPADSGGRARALGRLRLWRRGEPAGVAESEDLRAAAGAGRRPEPEVAERVQSDSWENKPQ